MKATAVAHPIQGLIKYHGLRDGELRLPYHDSISVCTAPLETRTTVELDPDLTGDSVEVDGVTLGGRPLERAVAVVDEVRRLAGEGSRARVVSRNSFPSNVGLGASASGFAALAVATAAAFGLDADGRALSTIARLGAGSAARAVTGGFSLLHAGEDHQGTYSERVDDGGADMRMVVALVRALKSTEDAHREVLSSPLFNARLSYVRGVLEEMRSAIDAGDLERIGHLAEADTLVLHGITMTGPSGRVFWTPETVRVMHEVRSMRADGLLAHFSIDTGATVYINCGVSDAPEVERRISELDIETLLCEVGGPAQVVGQHLF